MQTIAETLKAVQNAREKLVERLTLCEESGPNLDNFGPSSKTLGVAIDRLAEAETSAEKLRYRLYIAMRVVCEKQIGNMY